MSLTKLSRVSSAISSEREGGFAMLGMFERARPCNGRVAGVYGILVEAQAAPRKVKSDQR